MMKKFFILIFLLISIPSFSQIEGLELPKNDTLQRIVHYGYTLGYSEIHEQPGWVAYSLSQKDTINVYNKRRSFLADKLVKTGSAINADYKGSGYDRGHMAPAADMRWNSSAYIETFVYSNTSPQVPSFNRGKWRILEGRVRNLLQTYKNIYIVTGPILTEGLPTIGKDEVSVPNFYYKAVIAYDGMLYFGIAFILPNKKIDSKLENYIVSIDFVEAITGFDLFSKLPDEIEKLVESNQKQILWITKKGK